MTRVQRFLPCLRVYFSRLIEAELAPEHVEGVERCDLADARAVAKEGDALDQRFALPRDGDLERADGVFLRAAVRTRKARGRERIVRAGSFTHAFRHFAGALLADRAAFLQRFF